MDCKIVHIWKWQTQGLKHVFLQVCGEKLIYTQSFFFFFAKTNIHRITLINIRRNYVVIVNIKHEIGDEQIREKMETNIIMTVDTMSENIFLSKWFLSAKVPYSKPCLCLPRSSDKNIDQVLSALHFLEPHSSRFCQELS